MELWLSAVCIVVGAILIDAVIGEVPNAIHPLRWTGNLVYFLDRHIRRTSKLATRLKGFLSYVLVAGLYLFIAVSIIALSREYLNEYVWIVLSAFVPP